jgi:hypothetical protein
MGISANHNPARGINQGNFKESPDSQTRGRRTQPSYLQARRYCVFQTKNIRLNDDAEKFGENKHGIPHFSMNNS